MKTSLMKSVDPSYLHKLKHFYLLESPYNILRSLGIVERLIRFYNYRGKYLRLVLSNNLIKSHCYAV